MSEPCYAVYLFPQAIETLGGAIKPYLAEGPFGAHLRCLEFETGALTRMVVQTIDEAGKRGEVELMVPPAMVKLVVGQCTEPDIGFT